MVLRHLSDVDSSMLTHDHKHDFYGQVQTIDPRTHNPCMGSANFPSSGLFAPAEQEIYPPQYTHQSRGELTSTIGDHVHNVSETSATAKPMLGVPQITTPKLGTDSLSQGTAYSPTAYSFGSVSTSQSFHSDPQTPITPPDSDTAPSTCPSSQQSLNDSDYELAEAIESIHSTSPSYRQMAKEHLQNAFVPDFRTYEHYHGNMISGIERSDHLHMALSFDRSYDGCSQLRKAVNTENNRLSPIALPSSCETSPLSLYKNSLDDLGFQSVNQLLPQQTLAYPSPSDSIAPAFLSQDSTYNKSRESSSIDDIDNSYVQNSFGDVRNEASSEIATQKLDSLAWDSSANKRRLKARYIKRRKGFEPNRCQGVIEGNIESSEIRIPFIGKESTKRSERTYVCTFPGCHDRFDRVEHLKRHRTVHEDEEDKIKYSCWVSHCPKEIKGGRLDNLKAHVNKTHCTPSIKEPSPEKTPGKKSNINERLSMLAMLERYDSDILNQNYNKSLPTRPYSRDEEGKQIRSLVTGWVLLLNTNPKKPSLTIHHESEKRTGKRSQLWTTTGWNIQEAHCIKIRDLAPEYDGPAENVYMSSIDPRMKALYATDEKDQLTVADCKHLGVSMKTTRDEMGLQQFDPRWRRIWELSPEDALKEDVEDEWIRGGGGSQGCREKGKQKQDSLLRKPVAARSRGLANRCENDCMNGLPEHASTHDYSSAMPSRSSRIATYV
ncbi:uncharacterized protein KY384_006640 [Bacidia gigantensis]|uniref:uncharacterized protein n=1 Tax=Bacidia gigantensis TaxID=2732470 RepID=UPI001D03D248|nr:uncharacterized protein KY384_006640 [Bacidia gigantensis]KAG8528951.1 hypothetical protein KY384_006640 [Bacidia gigantensis]